MNSLYFILQQARSRKWRTASTVVAVALVIFCFLLLQTVSWAWKSAVQERRDDRVAVWNKTSNALNLPKSYVDDVAKVAGVHQATFATFLEGFDPNARHTDESLFILAIDPSTYFGIYPETKIAPKQLANWKSDPYGVVLSRKIADQYGYRLGDHVTIEGRNYPGVWHLMIRGIYTSDYRTFEDNLFFLHWNYLNDQLKDDVRRNEISWVMCLVDRAHSIQIAKQIEDRFVSSNIQVRAMTERSMVGVFMSNFSGILSALNVIGIVLVLTMGLILLNLVSVRLRERKFELGILRAIGFSKRRIIGLILAEAALVGLLGGVVGIVFSKWIIDYTLGAAIEQHMGSLFPYFSIPEYSMVYALLLPVGLALSVGALQAYRASDQDIANLLKDIE